MSEIKNEIYTESDRAFKGVYVPAGLWLNSILSWTEKIILLEIRNLDKDDTHCFASNAYIAKFAQCSETSVKSAIQLFKTYGIIQILSYDGRKRVMAVSDNWEQLLNTIDSDRSLISPRAYRKKLSASQNSTFSEKDKNRLSASQNSTDININNINNSNELFYIEKNKKEINKEISEVSETNVHTNDASPYGNEELTPNPLIRNDLWKLIYDFSISRKAFTNQVLELLTDYVLARLEQNPNLTVTQLKASIRSLDQVVHECNNPQLFNKYVEQAIINATTGPYAQFKAPFDTSSKNNNSVTEKATKIPFGDHSKCIPATDDIELATDENGNPLKF